MLRVVVSVLVVAVLAVVPASAVAQRCDAPAGTGAVDEYCEVVPGPGGDRDPGPEGGPSISNGTTTALTHQGSDGEALARALGGDTAAATANKGGDERPGQPVGQVVVPDTPSSNPFSAVTRAVGGNTTLGSPFFLALFSVVLVMLGSAWVGYRRSNTTA